MATHDIDPNETFRLRLIGLRTERGLSSNELSRAAGLNLRAVRDIEEGRSLSPKLSTAMALAGALEVEPGELLGLAPRPRISPELVAHLESHDEEGQRRILSALRELHSALGRN